MAQRESARTIRVTAAAHLTVQNTLACLSRDAGQPEQYEYVVPRRYAGHIASAEVALRALNVNEFQASYSGLRTRHG